MTVRPVSTQPATSSAIPRTNTPRIDNVKYIDVVSSGDIMVRKSGPVSVVRAQILFDPLSGMQFLLLKNINDHLWKGAPNSGRMIFVGVNTRRAAPILLIRGVEGQ